MKRRLFNLVTLLSLLLCVATVALWVRSYWFADYVGLRAVVGADARAGERNYVVTAERGKIVWGWMRHDVTFHSAEDAAEVRAALKAAGKGWARGREPVQPGTEGMQYIGKFWNRLGFGRSVTTQRNPAGRSGVRLDSRWVPATDETDVQWWVAAPHWAVFAVTMVLPIQWLANRLRRQRRRRRGLCPACGYDLRASPGCCPECGGTPAQAKTK